MFRGSGSKIALVAGIGLLLAACSKGEQDGMGMESASAAPAGSPAADAAEYTVIFKSRWSRENHPLEYPEAGAVSGPHFSGIIGASHNPSYTLFASGGPPTPGLERLSEEGKHSPLDEEISAAVSAGSVAHLFTTGPLRDLNDSLVATVRVDAAHPLISLVAMIAPSPDWFAGVAGVNLMENGQWVASRTIPVNAWDSGGDEGMTYKAADRDNNPKKPTTTGSSRHFAANGAAVPVATLTLIRK